MLLLCPSLLTQAVYTGPVQYSVCACVLELILQHQTLGQEFAQSRDLPEHDS